MDDRQLAAERIGSALTQAGMPRIPARVFSALLVDDDGRMTSVELTGFLGVSPSAVSGAVKYLTQLTMVRRERHQEPGSRRDVYVVDPDAWTDMMTRRDQLYAPIRAALAAGRDLLDRDSPAALRVERARAFLVFLDEELGDILTRWEKRRDELGLG